MKAFLLHVAMLLLLLPCSLLFSADNKPRFLSSQSYQAIKNFPTADNRPEGNADHESDLVSHAFHHFFSSDQLPDKNFDEMKNEPGLSTLFFAALAYYMTC